MEEVTHINCSFTCRAHGRHLANGNSSALDKPYLSKTWKLLAFYWYNLTKCKRRCSLFWPPGYFGNIFDIRFRNPVSDTWDIYALVFQVTQVFLLFVDKSASWRQCWARARLNAGRSLDSVSCVAMGSSFKFGRWERAVSKLEKFKKLNKIQNWFL